MGKPLLERNFENLKRYGIYDVVLSMCYQPEKIENYFGGGKKFDVNISFVTEEIPLGTAGAIKNAQDFFDDTFLVFNADILSDIDFTEMIRFHKDRKALATIAATRVDNPWDYGVMEHDGNGFITGFKEKPKPHESDSNLINAGVYIFEPELLDHIPQGKTVSIERETYPQLLQGGHKMAIYNRCSYWLDLGTPQKYLKVHRDILEGLIQIGECDFTQNKKYISRTAKVHPTARIAEPVYIGDGVEIGSYAAVGPGTVVYHGAVVGSRAAVVGSVVWDNVKIENGASVENSVAMSNCVVARNSKKHNAVLTKDFDQPIAV